MGEMRSLGLGAHQPPPGPPFYEIADFARLPIKGMVPLSDGWQVRVTTLDPAGRPAIFRHYLVFEADKDRAIALVRMDVSVNAGESVEAVAPLARNEFLGRRMKPGDVKLQV